ncbi:MAG: ACT domain-containing protein [Candidatus Omnitrophica bacterium]|nr:ACT domain-containing protein [Candidatus Omnitrophota bacterium]MCM8826097.1 ACT domain-containing protein [Candidatus Omnitrophota bacterium]
MKVVKGEEIFVTTSNKVGTLAAITEIIADAEINIRAISAYVVGDRAFFRLITSDNNKTKEVLSKNNYSWESKEVVIVELIDKAGQLYNLASLLKKANVDLNYIYGTTSKPLTETIIIFSSNDNDKAIDILSS